MRVVFKGVAFICVSTGETKRAKWETERISAYYVGVGEFLKHKLACVCFLRPALTERNL